MSECPKCGAAQSYRSRVQTCWTCWTVLYHADGRLSESVDCLRRQLAAVTVERDRLQAVQLMGMSRVSEATAEWQAAHATDTLPDLGTLIAWLRAERDARVTVADVAALVLATPRDWWPVALMRDVSESRHATPAVRALAARVAEEMNGESAERIDQ